VEEQAGDAMEVEQAALGPAAAQPLEPAAVQPAAQRVDETTAFYEKLSFFANCSFDVDVTAPDGTVERFAGAFLQEQWRTWGTKAWRTLFPPESGPYQVARLRVTVKRPAEEDPAALRRRLQEEAYKEASVGRSRGAVVKEPAVFLGKKCSLDVAVWLRSVESYFLLVREPRLRWLPVAESYLSGDALEQWTVHRSLYSRDPSWEEFQAFLLLHFGAPFLEQETRRSLSSLRVSGPVNTRNVAEMGQQLATLVAKTARIRGSEVTPGEAIAYFITALERSGESGVRVAAELELRKGLCPEDFESLARVVSVAARLAGEGLDGRGLAGPSVQAPSVRAEKPHSASGGRGAPRAGQSAPRARGEAGAGSSSDRNAWRKEPVKVNGKKNLKCLPLWLRLRRQRDGECLWCGGAGHDFEACTNEVDRPNPRFPPKGGQTGVGGARHVKPQEKGQ
jgi:hypothetical protein